MIFKRKTINRYCAWIEDNINDLNAMDLSDCEITFSKSGGPGGQNVNKRETKVSGCPSSRLIFGWKATRLAVRCRIRTWHWNSPGTLADHMDYWKEYLNPDQSVDLELVQLLLEKIELWDRF